MALRKFKKKSWAEEAKRRSWELAQWVKVQRQTFEFGFQNECHKPGMAVLLSVPVTLVLGESGSDKFLRLTSQQPIFSFGGYPVSVE